MRDSVSEQSGLAGRIGAWSVVHARWVVLFWVLLTVVGGLAAARSGNRLSFSFDLPGQPAYETNTAILRQFHNGGDNPPLVAVVRLPEGSTVSTPGVRAELERAFDAAAAAIPGTRAASWISTGGGGFVSGDGRTTFEILYPPVDPANSDPYTLALPRIEHALSGVSILGQPIRVTGATILATGGQGGGNSVIAETLVAGVGALIVLAVVFGSFLALLPLLIAIVAIPTTFAFVYLLTYVTTMSTLVQNTVALIGLGVAVDYALLICTRWREERGRGLPSGQAVLNAASAAGASVLFSGVAFAVSLAALALTPVPFLRSIGLGGLLIAVVSVGVALTLLPVLLNGVGEKLEWPRRRTPGTVSRTWTAVARLVVRRPLVSALLSLLVMGVLVAPVLSLHLGEPQASATAGTAPAEARLGYQALADSGIGAGVLRPIELLSSDGGAVSVPDAGPGGHVVSPDSWTSGTSRLTDVWSATDPSSSAGSELLTQVRSAVKGQASVRVGGTLAQDDDFIHALYGPGLIVIIIAIVVLTFLILARALRSIWLPIKALALNALSLAAAFGVLTFVWQEGHATRALFSSPATGAVTLWVPLAVFSLLFGLSMDYEVFILTRVNEEYIKDGDTSVATVRAIGHTGRLVSSGALILFLAFVALGGVPQTDVRILSTGLAAGVILDATIVRGILAPALVALLGRWNWVLPSHVARLLRIIPLTPGSPFDSV